MSNSNKDRNNGAKSQVQGARGHRKANLIKDVATPPSGTRNVFRLTDVGNAKRMVHLYGDTIRFVPDTGKWLVWRGTHWAQDHDGMVMRVAKKTVNSIYQDVAVLAQGIANGVYGLNTPDIKRQMELLQEHADQSERKPRLDAMISLATSEEGMSVSLDVLDADPMLLNVLNGTVDLKTGKLRKHSSKDMLTKIIPVEFTGLNIPCPQWDAFLSQIMCQDAEMVSFLQRAIGYALTGLTHEQCLFVLYGSGSNGKSTFIELVRFILDGYSQQADFGTFLERKGEGPRNDIARMVGARFVAATEGPEGKHLDEALIKWITGMDKLTARFLYKENFEFTPTHKIFLATNHLPVIKGADNGIWRRMRLVPFEAHFTDEQKDPELMRKLKTELTGILAWAVRGCLVWQEEQLGLPEKVKEATKHYRSEMDVLEGFLMQCCDLKPSVSVQSSRLYELYKSWAEENHYGTFSIKRFSTRLETKGFKKEVRRNGNYFLGLCAKKHIAGHVEDAGSIPETSSVATSTCEVSSTSSTSSTPSTSKMHSSNSNQAVDDF